VHFARFKFGLPEHQSEDWTRKNRSVSEQVDLWSCFVLLAYANLGPWHACQQGSSWYFGTVSKGTTVCSPQRHHQRLVVSAFAVGDRISSCATGSTIQQASFKLALFTPRSIL